MSQASGAPRALPTVLATICREVGLLEYLGRVSDGHASPVLASSTQRTYTRWVVLQALEAVLLGAELHEHYGVGLDFLLLLHEDPALAARVAAEPTRALAELDAALIPAQVPEPFCAPSVHLPCLRTHTRTHPWPCFPSR